MSDMVASDAAPSWRDAIASKKSKIPWPDKCCTNPHHGHKSKLTRQMHGCSQCYMEFIQTKVKEDMDPTDIVRRATFEFRNYFCPFCLDEHKHELGDLTKLKCLKTTKAHCKKHHAMHTQKTCPCGVLWRYCDKCDDYRAGTGFKVTRDALRAEFVPKQSAMAISNLIHPE